MHVLIEVKLVNRQRATTARGLSYIIILFTFLFLCLVPITILLLSLHSTHILANIIKSTLYKLGWYTVEVEHLDSNIKLENLVFSLLRITPQNTFQKHDTVFKVGLQFTRTIAPGQLSPGRLPLDNCHWTIAPGKLPPDNCPPHNCPGQLPRGQFPPDNCPRTIAPLRTIVPG